MVMIRWHAMYVGSLQDYPIEDVDHGNPVTKLASIQALEHGNAEVVHQGVMKGLATMELTAD